MTGEFCPHKIAKGIDGISFQFVPVPQELSMPSNVTITFSRLTSPTASAGGGETRLISPGASGTNFQGSVTFGANSLAKGDVLRVSVWGWFNNSEVANMGTARLRLYLNNGGALNNPIADTGNMSIGANATNVIWQFCALITIRSDGANGTAWCDCFSQCMDRTGWDKMPGGGSFNINTTQANDIELSAQVTDFGSVTLNQCAIERLPSP